MASSRRDFLSRGALLVASGFLAPSFLTRTALAVDAQTAAAAGSSSSASNRILVVLQLSGGNDGLDTVIPVGDPAYAGARGANAWAPGDVLSLSSNVGLHPAFPKIKALYDQGKVAVVQGVGYPNPNLSHFRSMDVWHSAHPESMETSGWLGRYLNACGCQTSASTSIPGISVGDQLNTMFWTDTTLVPAIASVGAFSFLADTKYKNDRTFQLQTLYNIYQEAGNWSPFESTIRQGTLNALQSSDAIQKVAASYQSTVQYPQNNGLATQLKLVAQIIAGNLGTRIFSVSMGGFDTHANEKPVHARLFPQMDAAVDAFMADLAGLGQQDNVTIMTFTEFGRRVQVNASGGTDHGTAEPLFVIGNGVKGGLYGTYPSVGDLDSSGNLKFGLDFRSVYAGMLRDVVGTDPTTVLGGTFAPLGVMQ